MDQHLGAVASGLIGAREALRPMRAWEGKLHLAQVRLAARPGIKIAIKN